MAAAPRSRMIVASNRLPLVVRRRDDGSTALGPGSGGLVTALAPVMRARGGAWLGWPGDCVDAQAAGRFAAAGREAGYELLPVALDADERAGFYHGFSNEVIWPLFHDLQSHCNFDPAYWRAYRSANAKFAAALARAVAPGDLAWVHDYQLMGVGEACRRLGVANPLAFFLHVPFPSPDIFMKLPWRVPVLASLLQYDLVGFQSPRDRRNFLDCVRALLPEAAIAGRGQPRVTVRMGGRETRVGRFPIGIDYNDFYRRASAPGVERDARALLDLLPDRQLVLGVDRLDYTKGIPERLLAFADALERHPELRERVTLIQVVVPSRADIPRYRELKGRIENLVGAINGRFTRPGGWVPIHYVFRSLSQEELLAYYRAARIALVTPLEDGMNLVAKEYCACSPDDDGVLVLSEFAGAAAEMDGAALLVNPHDIEAVADAIHRAFHMPAEERRARMRRLRRRVRRHDVYAWVESFLRAVPATGAPAAVETRAAARYDPAGGCAPEGRD